ncbi:MAG: D-galactarate dehydratase [Proteobacteria bacterium]|nr:D-galactarate dehydratase [Pseudomonadota bacterium]
MKGALILAKADNVATAIAEIEPGAEVPVRLGKELRTVKALERVPFGFKMAIADIPKGNQVIKYGEPIGKASTDIKKGNLVHIHNLEGTRGRGDLARGRSR